MCYRFLFKKKEGAGMKCSHCDREFEEKEIQLSHDVPCYLFWMNGNTRKERKQFADKYGRRYLCKKCHDDYEKNLNKLLIDWTDKYSKQYFMENSRR